MQSNYIAMPVPVSDSVSSMIASTLISPTAQLRLAMSMRLKAKSAGYVDAVAARDLRRGDSRVLLLLVRLVLLLLGEPHLLYDQRESLLPSVPSDPLRSNGAQSTLR
jgi:hypothetical protein